MLSTQYLLEVVNQYHLQHKNVWVAYSGGVDSHVLLELAKQSFPSVRAIHINHALHAEDNIWQAHCEQICTQLKIPLHCIKITTKPNPGQSLEDFARTVRRNAWQNMLSEEDVLLLAHHANDQAETILYRLLRGAGPQGLAGMQICSKLGKAKLIRPFLNTAKSDLVKYATDNKLNWIDDKSNQKSEFDRNYIRNNLMPILQQRWPQAISNINRAGLICNQMMQGIAPLLQQKLVAMLAEKNALDYKLLENEDLFWQQELLRAWLKLHNLTPSLQQLKLLKQQVINARAGAMPQLQIGDKFVKRSKNKLYVVDAVCDPVIEFNAKWNLSEDLKLPNGQTLTAPVIFTESELEKLHLQQITVRMGVLGRKAKKIFQQHAIPPWERNQYPLVFANDRLVGVVGLWSTNRLTF